MDLDWRKAHAWLRGFSDAQLAKPEKFPATLDEKYQGAYASGYRVGAGSPV
jgi:hypothetical protein